MNYLKTVVIVLFCALSSVNMYAQTHPSLMLTQAKLAEVRLGSQNSALLKSSYQTIKKDADLALKQPINVPVPKDGGGGYTHEQHKRNYTTMLNCATVYQITNDEKYANYVKDILLAYASQYEKWPVHPKRKDDKDGGRIFWQSLNDFVWQVYTIQAYDLVYNAISKKDRATIEQHLFMPILKFFTVDRVEIFDQIHNHGTWNLAAVGMTAYVLNKPDYVQMALKGSKKDGKSGFLAQIDQLFSPDGYYMEGPYYQRYALLPFVMLAKAINNYQPELNIFEYRNKLLSKAIHTALQLTYTNKAFFPINDAIKDKTYESVELVYGLDIAYADIESEADLLDIAQKQGRVIVSDAGLKVSKAIDEGKIEPFKYKSLWVKDGAKGDEGGLGILRYGPNTDQQLVLMKAASQGMGHGHFDRLNLLFYDNGEEIFPDYGSARFLNIDTKRGGGYLPENNTWAKQTVAHNTLVVDQVSHFKANVKAGDAKHPDLLFFSDKPGLQVVSAKEDNAYADTKLIRTSALIKIEGIDKPILVDVFRASSANTHQFDLPFWYKGQLVNSSFKVDAQRNNLQALGNNYGYQHLWFNAQNQLDEKGGFVSILNNKRFYTTTFVAENPLQVKLVSIGANDPEMNLVDGKAFILSQPNAKSQTFVSITETHGGTDPINETVASATQNIKDLKIISSDDQKAVVSFKMKNQQYQYSIDYNKKKVSLTPALSEGEGATTKPNN
ncbi:alginate lyase family protein [Pedobacter arcticus]|uniref:alginate lyase family protein n=1 Tax=Pedobacter arcticus TaxID=752140 RepID=UPI0003046B1E|nr:alginate lyase family protein [Pedobacter arcticus]